MKRDEIKDSIEFFLKVVAGSGTDEAPEAKLQLALDRLALAYHFANFRFDEKDYPESPVRTYQAMREVVSATFPNLGYYNVAADISEKIAESLTNVGDAIDDICDIAGELENVLWCWDNTTVDNALWHFRFGYESHWGKHLRDLQLYLYAKEHGW